MTSAIPPQCGRCLLATWTSRLWIWRVREAILLKAKQLLLCTIGTQEVGMRVRFRSIGIGIARITLLIALVAAAPAAIAGVPKVILGEDFGHEL